MQFLLSSHGLYRNPQIQTVLQSDQVSLFKSYKTNQNNLNDTIAVGWGYKPTTNSLRLFANQKKLDYWALEDGFISWLNHPFQQKPYQRLSYILDKQGIYYDASCPSGIDLSLENLSDFDEGRVERLRQQITKLGVSKYNQARADIPKWLSTLTKINGSSFDLLVDQTFADASIKYSGGSQGSFETMLSWASGRLDLDPNKHLILKVHPDVLHGTKSGYLYSLYKTVFSAEKLKRVHLLVEDIAPKWLFERADAVATVSSQMGFEALLYGKPVHCFAFPFYAGRGLTEDYAVWSFNYERRSCSLNELIHVALIEYPLYLHPSTQQACEIEEIMDYLQAHFLSRELRCESLFIPDVSLWKRSFIPEFIGASAQKIRFRRQLINGDGVELIWGMKEMDSRLRGNNDQVWRMEDGFIRSVGLGADLRRPNSLVLDNEGIYYNGKQSSRLETLLNNYELNDYEQARARHLIDNIIASNITKYNVEDHGDMTCFTERANGKTIILVVAQFQQDLSMTFGAEKIRDNLSLLKAVREENPEAYILFKEHPDVYSGVRPGKLDEDTVLQLADEYLTDTSITGLFEVVDEVSTICSLTGFEALLRDKKVNTYGLPFYAGWGLTQDRQTFKRRHKNRSIEDLVYITLAVYSRYVCWKNRDLSTPENILTVIKQEKVQTLELKSSWFARQWRKMRYLLEAVRIQRLITR